MDKIVTVKEILEPNKYLAVAPDELIRNVAIEMPAHHTSAAAVLDEQKRLIGIVTEQDIVERAIGSRRNVDETTVDKIMTPNPRTITSSRTLIEALDLMTELGVRTIPVIDGDKFIGIIDIRDLYIGVQKLLNEEISLNKSLLNYAFGVPYSKV